MAAISNVKHIVEDFGRNSRNSTFLLEMFMPKFFYYLRNHKFESYTIAFSLMIIPPLPMYFAAQNGNIGLFYILLSAFILGNLLVLIV